MPDKAYVPFLLQGDPFALEEMQFVANFTVCSMPAGNRGAASNWNFDHAARGMAWATRNRARTTRLHAVLRAGMVEAQGLLADDDGPRMTWITDNFVNNAAAPYSGLHVLAGDATATSRAVLEYRPKSPLLPGWIPTWRRPWGTSSRWGSPHGCRYLPGASATRSVCTAGRAGGTAQRRCCMTQSCGLLRRPPTSTHSRIFVTAQVPLG